MKQSDCRFREPYRDPKTHRPHPSKASVCTFPVYLPVLPNAYPLPTIQPQPVYPLTCAGCPCYEKRGLRFHQPHKQIEIEEVK